MPLLVTDHDGSTYRFDDSTKDFVKRIIEENANLKAYAFELEFRQIIQQTKLDKFKNMNKELVSCSLSYLDH